MNLTIANVLSCTARGCRVQPVKATGAMDTEFSAQIIENDIPIRPNQFVIVDQAASPPQTLFRFRRAMMVKVEGEQIELDDAGTTLPARRHPNLPAELTPQDEVVVIGHTDANRRVIDLVVDGKPAHPAQLIAEWMS